MARLKKDFFLQPTDQVAKTLLGKTFCRKFDSFVFKGQISETEAYLGLSDPACHSYNHRRTSRTEVMFGSPGTIYIYFIYGMYHCFNIVTGLVDVPEAVLLRGLIPSEESVRWLEEHQMASQKKAFSGPGKICKQLTITKEFNGATLWNSDIWIEDSKCSIDLNILSSPRIGLGSSTGEARHWPLRYLLTE